MSKKNKKIDLLPEEFSPNEEAAEFWDTHDTTDYSDAFKDVEEKAKFRNRHFQLEVDEDIIKELRKKAQIPGVSVEKLANEILRKQVTKVA